ncbi:MAG TPA: HAD-IA family hydrolase [Gemmatimonadaceae bacterium]|nr:HAD-IA family hydrolase [Gemmatimonadaceae bacterium]
MQSAMNCRALLFDLDGVLVDSAECVRRICTEWAILRGLDPDSVLKWSQGRRVQDTVRAVAPHLDVDVEVKVLVDMEANTTDGLHPVAGSHALLASLPPNAWAVVTSGARPVALLRLRHVGLPIPRTLITGDDVERGKPDPEGYLAAARALGYPPDECVVVEDAPAGVAAARAAGMRSIGVAGTFPRAAIAEASVVIDALRHLSVSPTLDRLSLSFDLSSGY